MMHITDWLPTIYSAAGGDVRDLGVQLDGIDMWDVIVNNLPSKRKSILHNIDDIYGNAALTIEEWKIVKGLFLTAIYCLNVKLQCTETISGH